MSRKIIFLDIDGVLNSCGSSVAQNAEYLKYINSNPVGNSEHAQTMNYAGSTASTIDKVAVGLLNEVCKTTGAYLVISSTHRIWCFDKVTAGFDTSYKPNLVLMENYMRVLGVTAEVVGMTPRLQGSRGEEIDDWLSRNTDVVKYVIIDDDSDMTNEQKSDHFIHTDGIVGFNFYDAELTTLLLEPLEEESRIVRSSPSRFSDDESGVVLKSGTIVHYEFNGVIGNGRIMGHTSSGYMVYDMSGNFHDYDKEGNPSTGRVFEFIQSNDKRHILTPFM